MMTVQGGDIFGNEEFGRYYYRMVFLSNDSIDDIGTLTSSISREVYNGTSAIHYIYNKTTRNQNKNNTNIELLDVYLDDTLNSLGGYAKWYDDGENGINICQTLPFGKIVSREQIFGPPFLKNADNYTFIGYDPITVGAGSYPAALHYTYTDVVQGEWDFWVAPGVPLFVKGIQHNRGQNISIELISWGPPGEPVATAPEKTLPQLITSEPQISPGKTLASLPAGMGSINDPAELNQLILQDTDFSSIVLERNGEFILAEKLDSTSTTFSGFIKGYNLNIVLEKDMGDIVQLVVMTDSNSNASKTYDQNYKYIEDRLQGLSELSVTANTISAGDQGKMIVAQNIPQNYRLYYIIFVRGNIFEMIILHVPAQSAQDDNVIRDLAEKADRKILALQK
jgi:hypothetical protein